MSKVFDNSAVCFLEERFYGCSLQELERATGVNRPGLYPEFAREMYL
jgi:hypothetical protein